MMPPLSPLDLSLSAGLLLCLALASWRMRLGMTAQIVQSGLRMTAQLALAGLVLRWLFSQAHPLPVAASAAVMLAAAAREVVARQRRPLRRRYAAPIAALSVFLSSFTVAAFALAILGQRPWYTPRLAIPLLGMLIGNAMTGASLAADRLIEQLYGQQAALQAQLALGATASQASLPLRRAAVRTGLTPVINSMAAIGLISLPGMMTGQILGGVAPAEAVKAQLFIMFLIAGSTAAGATLIVQLTARRLFDDRHRLRLDRLDPPAP